MMRKLLSNQKWLLVMAGALALSACSDDKSAQQAAGVPPVKVVTYTTQAQDVLVKAELPGRTKASKIAEVRPQVGGIILNRHFVEGSYVEEGTTLYQIDPAIYDAALKIAEAKLEQAKANQYAAAEKAKRINALSSSKAVSKQDVDDANAALIQANAQVSAAKAEVNNAEISLNYTKMLAPISGQIGRSNYTQGALVTAGQAMEMAVIQQNDPMRVDITYSAKDFTRMQKKFRDGTLINPVPGAIDDNNFTVHLVMDDGSIYPEAGVVKFSDRTVDPTTGSILIQAEFPNPDQLLLPGMFVRSIVDQGIQKDAIQIPQKAIYRDPKGQAFVIVVGQGNIAEVRPVEIEHANGNNWLISQGLKAGEQVVIEGIQQVQSMMRRTDKVPLNIANDAPTQTH
ncbi:efflux RND transporter periplasmic adaptor subunit [Wohlfahrtiimonas sp. G9077]|uniref:efflux RND transporter periplasmic adaptor subunit n=1 Tax=Wohlfahrtiimonas sp. G9077 TaxID=1980118 RepID=UPI000B97EFB8|nr:efflux RND transporter periplasmic adaptor subunit [Wohlfahrtiimonas sp. G9077]OYQ72757.1 efflux transporter periplasmic adaptor subunit [Wohlfahrtiimonas sp. G9077]